MIRIIDWLLTHFPCFESHLIGTPDKPYLLRKYLLPKRYVGAQWPGVFLHKFFRSDEDRFPHCHPWRWSFSLILTGGYLEWRFDRAGKRWNYRIVRPLAFNIIKAEDFHRVDLLDPERGAWSLFVAFGHKDAKRGEEWGFLDPESGRFTGWRDYLPPGADGLEGD